MKHTLLVRALVDKVGSQMAAAKLVGVSQPTIRSWMIGSDIFGANETKLLDAAKKAGVKASKDLVGGLDVTQVKGVDPRNGRVTDASTAFWVIPTAFLRWQMRSDPNKVAVAEVTVANEGFRQGDVVIVDTSVKEGDGVYAMFVDGNIVPVAAAMELEGMIGRIVGKVTTV